VRLLVTAALVAVLGLSACLCRTKRVEVPVPVSTPPAPCLADAAPPLPGILATECAGTGSACFDAEAAAALRVWLEESAGWARDAWTMCGAR
jgi:hypothetical protein